MEAVKYWKIGEAVEAKISKINGATVMFMEGEKYPLWGFPRTWLLFGDLSKLKHKIKNQIFNESWRKLGKEPDEEIIRDVVFNKLPSIYELLEKNRLDLLPPEVMCPSVREIHRAWTKVSPNTSQLRDLICLILQEDDSYRFRVQWLAGWFPFFMFNPLKAFSKSLTWLEHAEVIGDMKERIRLLRTVLLVLLKDSEIRKRFDALFKEIKWSKVKMTKEDKYFFRAKYFKVDLDKFDY